MAFYQVFREFSVQLDLQPHSHKCGL